MINYDEAKMLYENGKSLRQIELELGIDRKKLSKKFKELKVIVQKGIKDEDYKKACDLYKTGKLITSVAKELNLDRHTLSKKMESDGIRKTTKRHSRNTVYDNEVLNLYNENYSIDAIAKKLCISTNMVVNSLRANNINTDKVYRKYHLCEDMFDVIDTEAKAYWLGFLYADGYVDEHNGKIQLSLAYQDRDHIEKFKSFLSFEGNIYEKESTLNGKTFISSRIDICSKKLSCSLKNKGCFQNKSLALKFPNEEQVPKHLINHFMRGYFDGDGTVYTAKPSTGNGTKLQRGVEILGTKDFLDQYMIPLYDIGITKTGYRKHGEAYGSRHGGNIQVQIIYDFLYRDAAIYLDRKHAKFNCRLESIITEDSR